MHWQLRGLQDHCQGQQQRRQLQVPAELPACLKAAVHGVENHRDAAVTASAYQQPGGQQQTDIGQATGEEFLVRHHQGLRTVAVKREQLMQAQAGENPGSNQQRQVGAGDHRGHRRQRTEQGQHIALLPELALQIAPGIVDDHQRQHTDQPRHGQAQSIISLLVQSRLQPGHQNQAQTEVASTSGQPPEVLARVQEAGGNQRQGIHPGQQFDQRRESDRHGRSS